VNVILIAKFFIFIIGIFFPGLYLCSCQLLKMVFSMIIGVFDRALWNFWVISCLKYLLLTYFLYCFIGIHSNFYVKTICISSRLLELLEKLCLRVAVMMKVLVLKHKDVLSLRFWEGISEMKFLLHYIWFELMSAYLCVR
jgi:hypothetical protein